MTALPAAPEKSVKPADKPDSVHRGRPRRDRHSSGPGVAPRLGATYPWTASGPLAGHRGEPRCPMSTYLVLLRVEIARFTRGSCPPRLVSVALILTSRWTGVTCYAALCSPDIPPVPGFPDYTSGGLANFTTGIIRHSLCPINTGR